LVRGGKTRVTCGNSGVKVTGGKREAKGGPSSRQEKSTTQLRWVER